METILQKMREACKEASRQFTEEDKPQLQDVIVNTGTGEFRFIWQQDEK